jgi:integrase
MKVTYENGPRAAVTAEGLATGGATPVTQSSSHGSLTRRPVYSGSRRVPGLYERTLSDGSTVFDAAVRLGGKVCRRRLESRTKTDAIVELQALRVDHSRGQLYQSAVMSPTLAEVAADWLAHLESRVGHRDARRRYSARTVALYSQRLDRHVIPELGRHPVADVTVADVRRLVDRLGRARLAPSTVTGVIGIVSGLFRFAVKGGLAERNPVRDLDRDDRPGTERLTEPRYLTAAEIGLLLSCMTDSFRPVVAVCAFAGLRVSEALGLRWCDVDFGASVLRVSGQLGPGGTRVPAKTRASDATVPLLPALARELRAHRTRQASRGMQLLHVDALVFTTTRGKPQSRRNALRAVHAAGDAAGLNPEGRQPVGLHDLRHSYVALALAAGLSLAETAALARHANAGVTAQVYAGLADDGCETAAAKLVEAGFGR